MNQDDRSLPLEERIAIAAQARLPEERPGIALVSIMGFWGIAKRLGARINTSPYGEWIDMTGPAGMIQLVPATDVSDLDFKLDRWFKPIASLSIAAKTA